MRIHADPDPQPWIVEMQAWRDSGKEDTGKEGGRIVGKQAHAGP